MGIRDLDQDLGEHCPPYCVETTKICFFCQKVLTGHVIKYVKICLWNVTTCVRWPNMVKVQTSHLVTTYMYMEAVALRNWNVTTASLELEFKVFKVLSPFTLYVLLEQGRLRCEGVNSNHLWKPSVMGCCNIILHSHSLSTSPKPFYFQTPVNKSPMYYHLSNVSFFYGA